MGQKTFHHKYFKFSDNFEKFEEKEKIKIITFKKEVKEGGSMLKIHEG